MRNTLRQIALPITLIAFCASASPALASAGGQYHRAPPKPAAIAHQQERTTAEETAATTWESLTHQVPDLAPGQGDAQSRAAVPKPANVQPEKRFCRREAVEGTRIKRRVCKSVRQVAAEDREGKHLSEALLRYKMFQ